MRRIRYLPSFLSAAACAALLYGLSVRFPNPLTQALSPVNASPWELGKLAFWPCLPAVLTATALAVGLGAAGLPPVPLCLLAASHGLAAYALLLHRLRRGALYWYAALILLGVAYILFTILPPPLPLFTDPADMSAIAPIPF